MRKSMSFLLNAIKMGLGLYLSLNSRTFPVGAHDNLPALGAAPPDRESGVLMVVSGNLQQLIVNAYRNRTTVF